MCGFMHLFPEIMISVISLQQEKQTASDDEDRAASSEKSSGIKQVLVLLNK